MTGEEIKAGEEEESPETEEVKSEAETEKKTTRKRKQPKWKEELEKARAEAAEKHERLLRLAAEFENYKKRVNREFASLIKTANEALITQMLPVLDNFERALNHAKGTDDFDSFRKGVEMIYSQFQDVLKKQGLQPIEAVGKPFDPNYHEAMMQVDSDKHGPDTVVEELEKGYTLNNKVIRHTRVIVSK